MPAELIHLVRHGEVENPENVLYGRLPGFGLSKRGQQMAQLAATALAERKITALYASPLQRTRESAAPWADRFSLTPKLDERLIEPENRFEGTRIQESLRKIRNWPYLLNPWRPGWGEAFNSISARMLATIRDAHASVESGEAVLVSHQLPIWMVVRALSGKPLPHNPSRRRCALSSITTLEFRDGAFVEVNYLEPAEKLLEQASDRGAV